MTRENWLRRHLTAVLVGGTLAIVAIVAMLTTIPGPAEVPLDPASTWLDGGAAVANVLEDHGVDVHVVRNADALADADIDRFTTVLVTSSSALGTTTTKRLLDDAAGGQLVVVDPTPAVADLLGIPMVGFSAGEQRGDCAYRGFDELRLSTGGGNEFQSTWGCFGGSVGSWVAWKSEQLVVIGARDLFANDNVLAGDNAAISLALLGEHPDLVWYVPDPTEADGSAAQSLDTLIPRWLWPATLLVTLALIGTMIWRGRRFGPVLREPLPVSVKAIETTLDRGRIYRRSRDRTHAVTRLRTGTRSRLQAALHLPAGTDDDQLFAQIAAVSGRDKAEIGQLLSADGRAPADDRDLITLAQELAALEEGITSEH